jgi:hypothetical protein
MSKASVARHAPEPPRSEKAAELRNAKKDLEAIYLASNEDVGLWGLTCTTLSRWHEGILLERWDRLRKSRSKRIKAEAEKARQAAHVVEAAGDVARQRYYATKGGA